MDREIKFKVLWNGKLSINIFTIGEFWDRLVEMEFKDGGSLPFGDIDWSIDKVEYLQYSGLRDKYNVEIYEGDIVRLESIDISGSRITSVVFDKGCFRENYFGFHLDSYNDYEIEVIGNKYDNPELLA